MRVATFNIRHATAAAAVCARFDADVIGLQEVDRRAKRSGRVDQAAVIAEACGTGHVFGPAHRIGLLGRFGVALLSRHRITDVAVLPLPRPLRGEPRVALLARTAQLSVAVTHVGPTAVEATAQLAAALEALVARPPPRLLLGDFNLRPGMLDEVVAAGFVLAAGGPTFPAHAPQARIDHVAVNGFTIEKVEIPVSAVSDHLPVVVSLR